MLHGYAALKKPWFFGKPRLVVSLVSEFAEKGDRLDPYDHYSFDVIDEENVLIVSWKHYGDVGSNFQEISTLCFEHLDGRISTLHIIDAETGRSERYERQVHLAAA